MKKLTLLILLACSNNLLAINSPTIKWKFNVQGKVDSSPTVSPDGQTIYVGSEDQHLWALNADGTEKWTYPFLAPVYASPAISNDGSMIYVSNNANSQGTLYAINKNGVLVWKTTAADAGHNPARILATPKVDPVTGYVFVDGFYYINSPQDLYYYQSEFKFNSINGNIANPVIFVFKRGSVQNNVLKISTWESAPDGQGGEEYVPQYAIDGINTTQLINSSLDGNIFCPIWFTQYIPGPASFPTVDLKKQLIYVGDSNGNLYAYTLRSYPHFTYNILPIWIATLGGDLSQSPPVVAANGIIYEGSSNGYLYALNTDETQQWSVKVTSGEINYRVAVDNKSGMIYVTDSAGNVYGVEPTQGKTVWESQGIGADTAPTVGADGTIYVGTTYGDIIAFVGPTAKS